MTDSNAAVETPREATPTPVYEVVLPGGGTNGLAVVGCLQALAERGLLRNVRRWVGGSSGATTALTMVLGYTPRELYEVLLHVDFKMFNDINCDSILACYDTMGLSDAMPVMRVVHALLHHKGFTTASTFADLLKARPEHELVITGYNLSRGQTEAFSVATTPDMPLALACRISIAVPFLFRPVLHKGDLYTDGCILENVPVRFARDPEHALVLKTTAYPEVVRRRLPPVLPNARNLLEFFGVFQKRLYHALDEKVLAPVCASREHTLLVISLPRRTSGGQFVVDHTLDADGKARLFRCGHQAGKAHQIGCNIRPDSPSGQGPPDVSDAPNAPSTRPQDSRS